MTLSLTHHVIVGSRIHC